MRQPYAATKRLAVLLGKPGRYLMATHGRATTFELMPDMMPVRADVARMLIEPSCNPVAYVVSGNDGLFDDTPQTWTLEPERT